MDRASISKWINASIVKHFSENLGMHLHVRGAVRDTADKKNWCELKVDGPYIHQLSKGYYKLNIEIDAQIYSLQDSKYLYTNQELQGKVLEKFTETISIYKLGNKSADDGDYLFCIKLDHDDRHALDVAHFGFTDKNEKIEVSDIEGHYFAKVKNF